MSKPNTISKPVISWEQPRLLSIWAMLSAAILFLMFFNDIKKTVLFAPLVNNNAPQFNKTPSMAVPAAANTAAAASGVSDVVTAAQAFKASLTSSQQSTLQKTYTTTLARKWSNLPCGSGCRNGIQFSTLSSTQLALAKAVVQAALGTGSNQGYNVFLGILAADDYLGAYGSGNSGYSSGIYFISFLNEPSTTGAWMLQVGGHHMAFNIAFNGGIVVGTTPVMLGVEPTSFTYNSTAYAPLTAKHDAMAAMLASLSSTQLTTAKLSSTFSDCLMSPGESNGNTNTMPSTKQGLICSGLSTTQKNLVIAAIQTWTDDMDASSAATLLSTYSNDINNMYIGWTGSGTSGSASTFLNANTNYVRIDGTRVWIEFVCQNGVIISNQIHYHSVWRDHKSDYGVDLTGVALPVTLGNFTAYQTDNMLEVEWSITSEKNNAYFDVEASADGKEFKKIGTVLSKATGGNSDVLINYEFSFDLSDGGTVLGLSVLGIALIGLLVNKRNKRFFIIAIISCIGIIGVVSCSKGLNSFSSANTLLFVRLKQVDKDGSFEYSKVIQAIKK